ncbi:MAG TPA: M28 family peptidase [Bryobacteraceae bacterium]|nr:M28 family peptidase [Bryobacteraceae bacterium]
MAGTISAKEFDGKEALEITRRVVAFGPRPPASPAIHKLQAYLLAQLKSRHCEVQQDDFTAVTPNGPVAMKNIIARFPGTSGRAIVLTGHYDTKLLPNFVGADDGGSSTGFLLEMASVIDGQSHADDIYLVWFDGEEAFREWTDTDSVYGSRHLAEKWSKENFLGRIKALVNIDMIGDKNLDLLNDTNSSQSLRQLIWDAAYRTGYSKYFQHDPSPTEDDHIPFVRLGVNAVDVIDLDYEPWHTPQDTMDKLSAHSFQVVGDVVTAALKDIEKLR